MPQRSPAPPDSRRPRRRSAGALSVDGGVGGDLESMAINLVADTAGAALTVSGTVSNLLESPGYHVDVDLAHPSGESLVETVIGEALAGAALGAVRVSGKVSGDWTEANIADIDATFGESTLSGDVLLRLDQEPPALHANLQAGTLDLAWVGGGLAATDGNLGADIEVAELYTDRWSDEPVDLALLDRLSGKLALKAEALVLGPHRIESADIDLSAAKGTLTLRSLEGRLFGGALEADGSLAGGSAPSGQAAIRLVDADLGAILREVAGERAVSGTATIDGYSPERTDRARDDREPHRPRGDHRRRGRGRGPGRAGDRWPDRRSRHSRCLERHRELRGAGGAESFKRANGDSLPRWRGVGSERPARIDGFEIVADGGIGDISGTADLPAWQLDLTALFRLAEHADAPPVGVRLEGSIDRPERHHLIEEMQAHLVQLGLLSLAGSDDAPKITLRKGAKAEPGTEIDTLLRNVLGDPDEAEDAGPAKAPADVSEGATRQARR